MPMTSLMGSAKPMPSMVAPELVEPEYLAVVMPMTLPFISNRGPPELPELMATSVCSMLMGRPSVLISRSRALM